MPGVNVQKGNPHAWLSLVLHAMRILCVRSESVWSGEVAQRPEVRRKPSRTSMSLPDGAVTLADKIAPDFPKYPFSHRLQLRRHLNHCT